MYNAKWSRTENWVWSQIIKGEDADLSRIDLSVASRDPQHSDDWSNGKKRIVSPHFLVDILTKRPFIKKTTHKGVVIKGALFTEKVDLSFAQLTSNLRIISSRFSEEVKMKKVFSSSDISFEKSCFVGPLYMRGLRTELNLFLNNATFQKDVDLERAEIHGTLSMEGSIFHGMLRMDNIAVDSALCMSKCNDIDTHACNLVITSCPKHDYNGAIYKKEILLRGAKIGSCVNMAGAIFEEKLRMENIRIGDHLYLVCAQIKDSASLLFSEIKTDLDISNSEIRGKLDLTEAKILSGLRLGCREDIQPTWDKNSSIILKNAKVGSISEYSGSWPNKIELSGFVYEHLEGFKNDDKDKFPDRSTDWMINWLGKQNPYTPQPYYQLSSVLMQEGQKYKAYEIAYEGRRRELDIVLCKEIKASAETSYWNCIEPLIRYFANWLQKVTIGFGYRNYLALIWASILTLIGCAVLSLCSWCNAEGYSTMTDGRLGDLSKMVAYSFDMLLPIIHLDENHYHKIHMEGILAVYFYFQQIAGHVIGIFAMAGLSGLTRKI
ncbi:MAG: hypothetical protein OEZ28_06825 [Nitrospinota bacterium]|nr:hypothetical protein [Nitrospinota bacterium]